jgi:putative MATE family efflux protein
MPKPIRSLPTAWGNKAMFGLLWPLVIEQLLAVTMGAADTIMVSSVGEFAVSGVNVIDNINNLFIIAFSALCTGGSVVVSQYIGRQDSKNASLAAKQLVYSVAVVALVIMAFTVIFRRPLIRLIYGNIASDVMNAATIYFLITACSYPFLAIYNANAAIFRAMGNSNITMRIALLVNVINIGGNAFLIFGLHLGVAGAALSTLASRIAAAFITLYLLTRKGKGVVSLTGILKVRLARPMLRNILNVGIPSGLESSMFQLGRLLTQRIFTTFGTAAMAGNAIASVINSFSFQPGSAYSLALLTIVGQCVGARDFDGAKKNTKKVMKLSYITIILLSGIIWVFVEPVIGLFNLGPEAALFARSFLKVHCISMAIGWPMSFALPNALRAAGDARYVMIVASVSMWTIRVSVAYLLSYAAGIGPLGVWLAMGGDFLVRGSFYFSRWKSGKWQNKKVIGD